jgi:octaprenyl-diphosphate synthase
LAVLASKERPKPAPDASLGNPSIEALTVLVAPGMERVNGLILQMAGSNAEMIPEVARHLIDSGGKRLRPMLTLASAQAFGYEGDHHVRLAAAVEFMHTATLLHDDVVDESEMRRGKLAARMLWGNQASVLVGDYLLGQAFRTMVEVGSLDALRILADAAAVIAEGEVLQLAAAKNLATAEAAYLRVIDAKTAALFAAACEVGPIVAGAGAAQRAAMAAYGRELGLAFQLVDDALDYGGSSMTLGKRVGDDFREGKITLPIVLAARAADAAESAFWSRTVERGEIADGDLEHAIALLARHGAIAETVERARTYGARAVAALDAVPAGAARDALADVVAFCVSRVS